MNNRLLTVSLILCAILLVVGLMPVHGEAAVYNTVVRLHVLANSDSEEDQTLKLAVRDAVLEVTSPLLTDCKSQDEARAILEAHTGEIQAAAEAVIERAGREDPVTILFGMEDYPTRDYESFCFPEGEYLSLRVCIGEGAGQNWWCCVFPPLCVGSASASKQTAEDAFIRVGLTPSQYKIITESEKPVYRVRFKLLEVFRGLF
ncbi:MAG: stage II sporulation protein R [Ruminococcaceae bacterium]|nr:stage II sporulation protein R [Oscillospiraceae bacterium]